MAYAGARFAFSVSECNTMITISPSPFLSLSPSLPSLPPSLPSLPSPQLLKAMKGESVTECAYVSSDVTEAAYFATPLQLGVSHTHFHIHNY